MSSFFLIRIFAFVLLGLIGLAPYILSQQVSPTSLSPPVVLADNQEYYPLGHHLAYLEDPSGTLNIEAVSSPEWDAQRKSKRES